MVNETNQEIEVTVNFKEKFDSDSPVNGYQFKYIDSVLKIDKTIWGHLSKKLSYKLIDSMTMRFVIPEHTTLHICQLCHSFVAVDDVILRYGGVERKFSRVTFESGIEADRSFFSHYDKFVIRK